MRCPNQQRCTSCQRLLIHKGSRSIYESASYFGQIVHNLLPPEFTFCDIDGALYRRSIRLLRFFEHKSAGQHRKAPQQELLSLLARVVEHLKGCPRAREEFGLHERSGVFLIEGDPHEGNQLGPSQITRLCDGKVCRVEDELEMLCWIALLQDARNREYIRSKLARRRAARGIVVS
jgi:hypothetical protein